MLWQWWYCCRINPPSRLTPYYTLWEIEKQQGKGTVVYQMGQWSVRCQIYVSIVYNMHLMIDCVINFSIQFGHVFFWKRF